MKIVYLSGTGFTDTDFSIINAMKTKIDLYYFIIVSPTSLKMSAINIEKQHPAFGIFRTDIYPEIEKFYDFIDLRKTWVINKSGKKIEDFCISIKLTFLLYKMNIDVLHMSTNYSILTLFLVFLRKKTFLTIHDPIPHSDNNRPKLDFIRRKITYLFINKYVIYNGNQKNEFIMKYKLQNKKIYVSKFGIVNYLHKYKIIPIEKNKKQEYILFFGRITKYKGLDFLFPAMKIVNKTHNIKLVVVGYCRDWYFDISEYESCPFIEIKNKYIPDSELSILIQNALFVVCPYVDATQSGVVMSSFAFNTPVLATNTGGLSEYVEHMKSGYIVPPKKIDELAIGIKYLLDNRNLLSMQKKYIEEKYNRGDYSWDKIVDGIIAFYKENTTNDREHLPCKPLKS